MMREAALSLALILAAPAVYAAADAPTIAAAVADQARPAADRARDAERKPAEMLTFIRIKPGMTVVDMLPGGGYFTRLFSTAVGEKGKVIGYVPEAFLATHPKGLDGAKALSGESGRKNVEAAQLPGPPNSVDVVWTSQNYHDLHNVPGFDLIAFNKLLFEAIKPGGYYVVLDHSAAAGADPSVTKTLHRIEAATVRKEVEAAGFKFDGESTALANPADPRTNPVFDSSIRGHTDQFVLRFRKPTK